MRVLLLGLSWACDPALEAGPLSDCLAAMEAEPSPEDSAVFALRLAEGEPDAAAHFAEVALAGVFDPKTRSALLPLCPECARQCPASSSPLSPEQVACLEWQADAPAGAALLADAKTSGDSELWLKRARAHVESHPEDAEVLYQLAMRAVVAQEHEAVLEWGGKALAQQEHFAPEQAELRIRTIKEERIKAAEELYFQSRAARGAEHPTTRALEEQRDALVRER